MPNITHYQINANKNHTEVPFHASQNGCYQKVYKQGDPEGWYGEGGGGGSGLGTRVHPWQIHVDVWQNQYNIVK